MMFLCSLLCLCVLQEAVGARLGGGDSCFEQGVDYLGNDLQEGHYDSTSSAAECQKVCQRTNGCEAWTWDPTYHNACWKKSAKGQTQANSKVTSGPKYCEGDEPTTPNPGGETDSMRAKLMTNLNKQFFRAHHFHRERHHHHHHYLHHFLCHLHHHLHPHQEYHHRHHHCHSH